MTFAWSKLALPSAAATPPDEPTFATLLAAIEEALALPKSGEVAVRSGENSGRVFVARGRIAWVTASIAKRTLGDRLVDCGVAASDISGAYAECRKSGRNSRRR